MADIVTLDYSTSPEKVRNGALFTHTALGLYPFTTHLQPEIEKILEQCPEMMEEDQKFQDDALRARVRHMGVRTRLNMHTYTLDSHVDLVTGSNSKAPLRKIFFGKLPPSGVRRFALDKKADWMGGWLLFLEQSDHESLRDLGRVIEADLTETKVVLEDQQRIQALIKHFRLDGAYKNFIDHANSIQKGVLGELLELQHVRSDLNLPKRWAYTFFLPGPTKKKPTRDEEIARLEKMILESQERRALLMAESEKEEQEREQARIRATLQALEAKQKVRTSLDDEISELKKQLSPQNMSDA